jgi:SAM-dependent methyltransferase
LTASDSFNIADAESQDHVDRINAEFYGRFPFPWPAELFTSFEDPAFWRTLTNQELGCYEQPPIIPPRARIWVAGCGTNQGIQTALRFPDCAVYATDISDASLCIAEQTARALNVRNVTFDRQSINSDSSLKFDYIICTGVIHHNADPAEALRMLTQALTPTGVLELMVYNRYHRQETTALQKAIRLLAQPADVRDDSLQLEIAERLMLGFQGESQVLDLLRGLKGAPTSRLADSVIQPVEWSYTVSSLARLVRDAGAQLWLPTQNMFDLAARRSWNLRFSDASLRNRFLSLPDVDRWQLANLLLAEKSPWLWFYVRPSRVERSDYLMDEVNRAFADASWTQAATNVSIYTRDPNTGTYVSQERSLPYPTRRPPSKARRLYEALEAGGRVSDATTLLQLTDAPEDISDLRMSLTTPYFPYLRTVHVPAPGPTGHSF